MKVEGRRNTKEICIKNEETILLLGVLIHFTKLVFVICLDEASHGFIWNVNEDAKMRTNDKCSIRNKIENKILCH